MLEILQILELECSIVQPHIQNMMEYIELSLDMKVLINNNTGNISLSAEASNCGEEEKP